MLFIFSEQRYSKFESLSRFIVSYENESLSMDMNL